VHGRPFLCKAPVGDPLRSEHFGGAWSTTEVSPRLLVQLGTSSLSSFLWKRSAAGGAARGRPSCLRSSELFSHVHRAHHEAFTSIKAGRAAIRLEHPEGHLVASHPPKSTFDLPKQPGAYPIPLPAGENYQVGKVARPSGRLLAPFRFLDSTYPRDCDSGRATVCLCDEDEALILSKVSKNEGDSPGAELRVSNGPAPWIDLGHSILQTGEASEEVRPVSLPVPPD